jgi:type III restriction enzyme
MFLKEYQLRAVEELFAKTGKLISLSGNKKIVFQSSTGSGKTIMMADFLRRLADKGRSDNPLSFIWTAPRKLHDQSKQKLELFFEENRAIRCSNFEDLDDKKIDENEVLFFNWESINKSDNIYIRDNEEDFNLSKVISNTREDGRKIVLIIDESHFSATGDQAIKLRNDINADLTIEVSATPNLTADEYVTVQIEDVISEGMIKYGVVLNEDFENVVKGGTIKTELAQETDEFVLGEALKKRIELIKGYKKEGRNINPLILIQLPDRKTKMDDEIKNRVIKILGDNGISTDNSKLAIHLSEEHENLDEISKNDNKVEVLIFKQALALGWDCPRAQILVLFRQWHSKIFSIQTVGRIMRMPEPELGHYENNLLNYSYVYTNLSDVEIEGDIARKYITIFISKRLKSYEPINLISYHTKRHREKTRLSPLFIKLFLEISKRVNLKNKIDIKSKKVDQEIISDWHIDNIDENRGELVSEGTVKYGLTSLDLQKYFDYFVRQNLSPIYPEDRTIGRVKEAIYKFFEINLNMKYEDVQDEIIKIVLSVVNSYEFKRVIDATKNEYLEEVHKREKELVVDKDWNIPEIIRFNEKYEMIECGKSIMKPVFTNNFRTEKAFIKYLEESTKIVKWWFKNGERDAVYFAVPYEYEGEINLFYIDYIVKLKDGSIGLFDTKSGFTLRDNKLIAKNAKQDGLVKYISKNSNQKQKLFGGVVTNTDSRNYKGRWVYFDGKGQEITEDFSKWKNLDL